VVASKAIIVSQAADELRAAKIARANIRQAKRIENSRQQYELIKTVLQDPLLVGLGAMVANELAYNAGFYDPRKGEASESILGGPTWITIGPSLPPAQAKRNLIRGMIIGVTTARALAPAAPLVGQGIAAFSKIAGGLMV